MESIYKESYAECTDNGVDKHQKGMLKTLNVVKYAAYTDNRVDKHQKGMLNTLTMESVNNRKLC